MYLAIANITIISGCKAFEALRRTTSGHFTQSASCDLIELTSAFRLTLGVLSAALQRPRDVNVLPLVHITLAFLYSILQQRTTEVEEMPWTDICTFMRICSTTVVNGGPIDGNELPEDVLIHSQPFSHKLPESWFPRSAPCIHPHMETVPVTPIRLRRILWLGFCMVNVSMYELFEIVLTVSS